MAFPLRHWALDRLAAVLPGALARSLAAQTQRLDRCAAALALLDPRLVLERGYAFLTDEQGGTLTRVAQVRPGQAVRAILADGAVRLTADR